MANHGERPSGQKATLPLPTAVGMRDEIADQPFARPQEDGQLVLLPTMVANPDNPGAGGELRAAVVHGEGRRNETGVDTLGRPNRGRAAPLLPTPNAEDGVGGRTRLQHKGGNPTLQGAVLVEQGLAYPNERERLLPTPVAEDAASRGRQTNADGSRNDSAAAKRSGAFTLTDIARMTDDKLLPTPTAEHRGDRGANSKDRGGGDEIRAIRKLLPTPNATDASGSESPEVRRERGMGSFLRSVDQLLPTPTTQDGENTAGPSQRDRNSDPLNVVAADLLPTPTAADGDKTSEQGPRHYIDGDDNPTLLGAARRAEVEWGVYEAAIRRWETVSGRPAPAPTDEKGRLAPSFVEWMLGWPEGWVDVAGVSRTRKLRILGNGVQVSCAEQVGYWLAGLVESGLL